MGIISLSHNILHICTNMSPKDVEVLSSITSTEGPVEMIKEPVITYQKFGEMDLPEDEEVDDGDYVPSDANSEDSLEWSSETERPIAEDALAEGTVGLDFYNAAYSVATEYVASYTPVQMGLSVATVVPVAFIQRAARAARRAGAKTIEVESSAEPSMVVSLVNSILNMVGFHLAPAVEDSSKPHLEPGTEPFTPEQEFGEMTLSDYDSDEDADYHPSESEESDELEYDSDISVSSEEETEEVADVAAEN